MNYYVCYKGRIVFDAKQDQALAESKLQKLSSCFTNLELLKPNSVPYPRLKDSSTKKLGIL